MGRIKTQLVKRAALKFMHQHPNTFKKDFSENKVLLMGVSEIYSKKLRNIIAGYLTRLVRQQETGK
ncbi:30S ribosomal protein S17e [Candidatus Woesearchaeota archaeon]|nr:30S ribosomal protein S17e [Candidatus Woesearchaeota archaeon]